MASTPDTNSIGIELQAPGENLNTWGDPKLNNALKVLSNLASKFHTIAITGDYTVSEINYSTTNDTEVALIQVTGSLTAAANFVMPGRPKRLIFWNATTGGYAVTPKLAATSGISVPMNGIIFLATDGATDVFNVGPTHSGTATQATDSNAYALWGAVETAIAAASGLTAPFILVSGADTTQGYLGQKTTVSLGSLTTTQLVGLTSLALDTKNSGGDEKVRYTLRQGYVGGFLNGGPQTSGFTPSQGYAYEVDCTSAGITVDLSSMTSVMIGHEIKLNKFGNNTMLLVGTVNGQTNLTVTTTANETYRYTGSSWGWN